MRIGLTLRLVQLSGTTPKSRAHSPVLGMSVTSILAEHDHNRPSLHMQAHLPQSFYCFPLVRVQLLLLELQLQVVTPARTLLLRPCSFKLVHRAEPI